MIQPQKEFNLSPFLMDKDNYQFSFVLQNEDIVYDKSLLNITFVQYEFRRFDDGSISELYLSGPSHQCLNKVDFPQDPDRWNKIHTKLAYCHETNRTYLIENSFDVANSTNPERHLRIKVYRCKNDTEPGVVCKPKEEMEKAFSRSLLTLKFKDS